MAARSTISLGSRSALISLKTLLTTTQLSSVTGRNMYATAAKKASEESPSEKKSAKPSYSYSTLKVEELDQYVLRVDLNRPDALNALNRDAWREIGECFHEIAMDSECRVVILGGVGKHFCSGIDLRDMGNIMQLMNEDSDGARKALKLRPIIKQYQDSLTSIEKCPKPVIAAVHGGCIGAGINMISACDIRYSTEDAFFSIREVDIGIAADVGVLQRMPRIVGNESLLRELAFTARNFSGGEARKIGLVSRTLSDRESLLTAALNLAQQIAKKSPVAVQGTKVNLIYSRDHSVQEGLDHMVSNQFETKNDLRKRKYAMVSLRGRSSGHEIISVNKAGYGILGAYWFLQLFGLAAAVNHVRKATPAVYQSR